MMANMYLLLVLNLLCSAIIYAQPGSLDSTFGNNGILIFGSQTAIVDARTVLVQSDDKIVVLGYEDGANNHSFVARFDSLGLTDPQFTIAQLPDIDLRSMIIQPDGKYLLGGNDVDSDLVVCRLNLDGTFDSTFSYDGIAIIDVSNSSFDFGLDLALQSDGRIVQCGVKDNDTLVLVRYMTDGSIDSTYGINGVVRNHYYLFPSSYLPFHIALQQDNKAIVAGTVDLSFNGDHAVIFRFDTLGNLDTTFDHDGRVVINAILNELELDVAIQNDRKIVVAGSCWDYLVIRLLSDGSLDSTMDGDGIVLTEFANGSAEVSYCFVMQPDNKIIVGGETNVNAFGSWDFGMIRFLSNGNVDNGFDYDGKVTTNIGYEGSIKSLAIQPDDKIVAFGNQFFGFTNYSNFVVCRYKAECNSTNITADPVDDSICVAENVYFFVAATGGGFNYQWQENSGSGFVNLANGGNYSGVQTDTLFINSVTIPMSGNSYRSILLNGCNISDTSSSALLYVDACVGYSDELPYGFMKLAPNPTDGAITIQFASEVVGVTVTIYDMVGQIVMCNSSLSGHSIALSLEGINPGAYTVVVSEDGSLKGRSQIIVH